MLNAVNFYRVERFFYKFKIPVIPKIIKLIIFLLYNSILPCECTIGKGTKLGYGGISVVIHKKASIGDNCMISQCVTIGGKKGSKGAPKIGNNVHIGAGAKILGDIVIGDNCEIGANAVILKDLPNNAIAVGVPGRIVRIKQDGE